MSYVVHVAYAMFLIIHVVRIVHILPDVSRALAQEVRSLAAPTVAAGTVRNLPQALKIVSTWFV